jgi:hypothetical protein
VFGPAAGVDPHELARLVAELEASGYHRALREYVEARTQLLLAADLAEMQQVMKCRGKIEELQRLVAPAFLQALALTALAKRAGERAGLEATAAAGATVRRDWWTDPIGDDPIP